MTNRDSAPNINRWYQEFEGLRQLWINWCDENITRFDSVWSAWQAFLEDLQSHEIQMYELKPEQLFNRVSNFGQPPGEID